MSGPGKYLLDANVFIEAKNRYYGFALCPGFWDCLISFGQQGTVASVDRVRQELERGRDDLSDWVAASLGKEFFNVTGAAPVIACFSEMMRWVNGHKRFLPPAKKEFAEVADGWLAAFAKVNGFALVTHESLKPDRKNKVSIPDVCQAFGVNYCDTFAMLRRLGAQFTWRPKG